CVRRLVRPWRRRYPAADVRAIHVNWTLPARRGRRRDGTRIFGGVSVEIPSYEILTTVLSACSWRALHGPIDLYTDGPGLSSFEQTGLAVLYDHIDTTA